MPDRTVESLFGFRIFSNLGTLITEANYVGHRAGGAARLPEDPEASTWRSIFSISCRGFTTSGSG